MYEDLDNIEGWLSRQEGLLLIDLARRSPGPIAEIGSWKGKSTSYLMVGAGSKLLYAIDPFKGSSEHQANGPIDTYSEFQLNINSTIERHCLKPDLHVLKTSSLEASERIPGPIGMIFIDGGHDYENVKLDYDLWYPKLPIGGIIAFHDSYWSGPARVIRESGQCGHLRPVHVVDSISWWFK